MVDVGKYTINGWNGVRYSTLKEFLVMTQPFQNFLLGHAWILKWDDDFFCAVFSVQGGSLPVIDGVQKLLKMAPSSWAIGVK